MAFSLKVTLKNNQELFFNHFLTINQLIIQKLPFLQKRALFAVVNQQKIVNLNFKLTQNTHLEIVTTKEFNSKYDHVLNETINKLIMKIINDNYGKYQLKIVNCNQDNTYFYFDFFACDFNSVRLQKLEKKLKQDLLNLNLELINNLMITNKKYLHHFSLLKVSALDNKENQNCKRIHGVCSLNAKLLSTKIIKLATQYQKSHRYLNKNLQIYQIIQDIGSGFPIWLPNGVIIKNIIKNYLLQEEAKSGFIQIETPILANLKIYLTSGHYQHYHEDMFPIITTRNNEKFMLRPMTCPHHIQVFKYFHYSYANLPIRFAEHSLLFRYEHSGALSGLQRVRIMQLTDAHLFITLEQLMPEFIRCFQLIIKVLNKFKIKIDSFHFCKHDVNNQSKYYANESMWVKAESLLEQGLQELKLNYQTIIGDAAFYGPKLDIQIKTALNKIITISTLQIDFLSAKKFDAYYINANNQKEYPIIIHRGLIGTYERFLSIIIEQNNGLLPLFLSPVQFIIFKITNKKEINEYALKFFKYLQSYQFRVVFGDDSKRLNLQIRNATLKKINYFIFIGLEEVQTKTIKYRFVHEKTNYQSTWTKFKDLMLKKIEF